MRADDMLDVLQTLTRDGACSQMVREGFPNVWLSDDPQDISDACEFCVSCCKVFVVCKSYALDLSATGRAHGVYAGRRYEVKCQPIQSSIPSRRALAS